MSDQPPAKPGFASTEFWQSILVTGVGLYLVVKGVSQVPANEMMTFVGAGMAGLSSLGYTGARAVVKR